MNDTAPAGVEDLLTLARALSDPTRLRVFLALRDKERCVSDLSTSAEIAQPLVSHHLRILAGAGLVQTRWSEGFKLYAVSPEGMAAARDLAMGLLDPATLGPQSRPGGNEACCR